MQCYRYEYVRPEYVLLSNTRNGVVLSNTQNELSGSTAPAFCCLPVIREKEHIFWRTFLACSKERTCLAPVQINTPAAPNSPPVKIPR